MFLCETRWESTEYWMPVAGKLYTSDMNKSTNNVVKLSYITIMIRSTYFSQTRTRTSGSLPETPIPADVTRISIQNGIISGIDSNLSQTKKKKKKFGKRNKKQSNGSFQSVWS